MLRNLTHKFLDLDLRLGQVSSNSENAQNLAVLNSFIKTILFPFYTNLQLLLRLANLQHKCFGLDQRLGQVSSNSETVQNLAVLHGFIKSSLFPFYTNLQYYYDQQIYNTNAWVQTCDWVKFRRILTTFKSQLFCMVLLKQVCFHFIKTCSYYNLSLENSPHKFLCPNQHLGEVSSNSENIRIQLFCMVFVKQVRFPYTLTCIYYYALQIYNTNAWVQTNIWGQVSSNFENVQN